MKIRPSLQPSLLLLLLPVFSIAQTWQPVNPALNIFNAPIEATAVSSGGAIYAAGEFHRNSNVRFVCKWNGADWEELGAGGSSLNANGAILSLALRKDTVFAAGAFVNASSKNYVAKWNGSSWSEVGTGAAGLNANGNIYCIVADKTGDLYAAGSFTNNSGKYYVAKWDGKSWSEMGAGANALSANNVIFSLAIDSSNNVYAGGYFSNAAGKQYVAKWNGTSWIELGTASRLNANDFIRCLAADPAGNIYAGGSFRNSNNEYYLAKWDGSSWSETGSGPAAFHPNGSLTSIALDRGNKIYVAGYFNNLPDGTSVARWDGTGWSAVNPAGTNLYLNDAILTIATDADNNVYAGGKFLNKSGHSFISKSNGTGWAEMGAKGDPFYAGPMSQVVADANGHVYVSGDNGTTRQYVEYWDGKGWIEASPPDGSDFFISAKEDRQMLLGKNGNLYICGSRRLNGSVYRCVLQWDRANWTILEDYPNSIGAYSAQNPVSVGEIEQDPQGNIYVAGDFKDANNFIYSLAKWDGKTWTRLPGSLTDYLMRFCVAGDGRIYGYGGFRDGFGYTIASYDSKNPDRWITVKTDSSRLLAGGLNIFSAIRPDSKNNIYVNGDLSNAKGNRYIAKWDGKGWTEVGATATLGLALELDSADNLYSNKPATGYDNPIRKLVNNIWVNVEPQPSINGLSITASILGIDPLGNLYSNADPGLPGVGTYIVKLGNATQGPKLLSFSPASGSVGTTIQIRGKNLSDATSVSFGGKPAPSFVIKNDSTLSAVVGLGSTGNIVVSTKYGIDSLRNFVFTCDSVKGPVPVITAIHDTLLTSTPANFYQWFYNGSQIPNHSSDTLHATISGTYRVETSKDGVCWVPSTNYNAKAPAGLSFNTLVLFPNPSQGSLTASIKLPQPVSGTINIQVFDLFGKKIFESQEQGTGLNEIKVPIVISNKGMFVVSITVNGTTYRQTAIVI